MRTDYYESLLGKLKKGFHRSKPHKNVMIILEFHEIEDLLILWEQDAKKKWPLTDAQSKQEANNGS